MCKNTDVDTKDSGQELPRDGAENQRRKSLEFEFVKVSLSITSNLLNLSMNYICMIFVVYTVQLSLFSKLEANASCMELTDLSQNRVDVRKFNILLIFVAKF